MAKKKTIRDLFVKLSNFFTDFHIIYNYYVLPGDKSDETTRGYYYCILEPDMMELCYEINPNGTDIIHVNSVRDAKDNIDLIRFISDQNEKKKIIDKLAEYKKKFETDTSDVLYWDYLYLRLTEDEKKALFNSESIKFLVNIFDENHDITGQTSVVISKTLFPLLTEKTLNSLFYGYVDNYNENNELRQLLFKFNYEYFQLNMRYLFIPLE